MNLNGEKNPELVNTLNNYKYDIASAIYGEMRSKGKKHWNMALSSLVNRIGKREWADMEVPKLLEKSFYAVSDTSNNKGWEQAQNGQFPDKESENKFKKILAYTSRAIAGDVDLKDNQFYFTKKEESNLAKKGIFDFSKVKKVDRVGNYNLYSYK